MNSSFKMFLVLSVLIIGSFFEDAHASVERSGSWYDPSHDGEGFIVQYIDDTRAVVYWFTYDEDGEQRWFSGVGEVSGDTLTVAELLITDGGVFGTGLDPANISRSTIGELTLTLRGDDTGLADYTINGVAGQQTLVRITRPVETQSSGSNNPPSKSGSWYDPARDGEGFIMEILPDGRQIAYWFTYDLQGNLAWMVAIGGDSVSQGSFQLELQQPVGGRFGPDFDPADVVRLPAGMARLSLQCTGGYADFTTGNDTEFSDIRFNLQRIVGIGPNACVDPALTNLYPIVQGEVVIPDHEAGRQLQWLLDKFAGQEDFTDAEITEHFSSAWLARNSIAATRTFLEDARTLHPNAKYSDPVGVTPMQMTGLISATNGREAFVVLNASLSEDKISDLGISPFGFGQGSVVFANDANLSLEQAADRFTSLSNLPSLLVAQIDEFGQCQPLVSRNEETLRSTASIFKIWILAGVADALDDGELFHNQVVSLDAAKQVRGGQLFAEPAGTELSIDRLATLMMGNSDNTATDMLHALAGRDRIDGLHAEYGHQTPAIMRPQLNISEQFHLFFSFPQSEAMTYVNGTEMFQADFLENRIVPLGSAETGGGGFFNEPLFIDGAWQASPMDICGAFARHREHSPGSDAALLVERALQSQAAQPNVREQWDRVWYKGGSLESGANGLLVLTHAFMVEREGEQPYVVIGMANNRAGNIDVFDVQSVLGRILELVAEL